MHRRLIVSTLVAFCLASAWQVPLAAKRASFVVCDNSTTGLLFISVHEFRNVRKASLHCESFWQGTVVDVIYPD